MLPREPYPSVSPPSRPPGRAPAHTRSLQVLLARRRRACRQLGLRLPREIGQGPPETLAYQVATLDRWLGLTLDRAGGVRLPIGDEDVDPRDGDEDVDRDETGRDETGRDEEEDECVRSRPGRVRVRGPARGRGRIRRGRGGRA